MAFTSSVMNRPTSDDDWLTAALMSSRKDSGPQNLFPGTESFNTQNQTLGYAGANAGNQASRNWAEAAGIASDYSTAKAYQGLSADIAETNAELKAEELDLQRKALNAQSGGGGIGGLLGGVAGSFLGPIGGAVGKQIGTSLFG